MAVVIPEEQVGASTDDCTRFTKGAGDSLNLTSNTVGAGFVNAAGTSIIDSGMRWTSIPVPQGATIISASISIFALSGFFVARTKLIGEDTDNAAAFSTLADYDGRSRTTARVDWDIFNNTDWHIPSAQFRQSPDISAIIFEICNRAGWSSGNDLALFWDDDGSLASDWVSGRSWNGNPSEAAKLNITFSAGGGQVMRIMNR